VRVAIDLSPRGPGLPLGVERVFAGALAALHARADVEVLGITPPEHARRGLRRAAWRQTGFVREALLRDADVLHSFVSAFPLRATVPVFATVHELPWRRGEVENAGLVHRAWARAAQGRATGIVCPSPAVARELGPNAHVIPWGLEPTFRTTPDNGDTTLRARLGLGDAPYVLSVGGVRAKKRLELLCAAQRASREPWTLVVTGPHDGVATGALATDTPGTTRDSHGRAAARVRYLGMVDDEELARLYRGASATAVLARSEGFGFPVLESFACGTPVVVPAASVQSDTSGGLARTFDGDDEALAEALQQLVQNRAETRERAALVDYAAQFTWARTAAQLVALWSASVGDSRGSGTSSHTGAQR
jgi:glycosyltransferase involved in cell wall biosynthesis